MLSFYQTFMTFKVSHLVYILLKINFRWECVWAYICMYISIFSSRFQGSCHSTYFLGPIFFASHLYSVSCDVRNACILLPRIHLQATHELWVSISIGAACSWSSLLWFLQYHLRIGVLLGNRRCCSRHHPGRVFLKTVSRHAMTRVSTRVWNTASHKQFI